jgi:hypothetical protein
MCSRHWELVPADVRRRLVLLDGVPKAVAVLLASDIVDARDPMWASGWSGKNRAKIEDRRRDLEAGIGRRNTCERIRADMRERCWQEYTAATGKWKQTLEEVLAALGTRYAATDVALAMIRSGVGTDGFCPFLVAAALDLDDAYRHSREANAIAHPILRRRELQQQT